MRAGYGCAVSFRRHLLGDIPHGQVLQVHHIGVTGLNLNRAVGDRNGFIRMNSHLRAFRHFNDAFRKRASGSPLRKRRKDGQAQQCRQDDGQEGFYPHILVLLE